MNRRFTVKQITEILGADVSTSNSKMPGTAFGLSAFACITGAKLALVEGSSCSKCYALKLEKLRPSVHMGYMKRTMAVWKLEDSEFFQNWVTAMAQRIDMLTAKKGEMYHRWHDSGDLQSYQHLWAIVTVAGLLPHIKFWLPTNERKFIKEFMDKGHKFPLNLTVRLSSAMVDTEKLPVTVLPTSSVHKHADPLGHVCPASQQGNNCGACRSCWNSDVKNVSYPQH